MYFTLHSLKMPVFVYSSLSNLKSYKRRHISIINSILKPCYFYLYLLFLIFCITHLILFLDLPQISRYLTFVPFVSRFAVFNFRNAISFPLYSTVTFSPASIRYTWVIKSSPVSLIPLTPTAPFFLSGISFN